jgi:hypothetical protein
MSRRESTLLDPVLGRLTFNRGHNWYEGAINLENGHSVKIAVDASGSDFDAAKSEAGKHLPSLLRRIDVAKDFAASRLLKLKNENWLEDNQKALEADEFKACLEVESATMFGDGDCELYLRDGNLFGGHSVLLRWDPQRGYYDADLFG